MPCFIVSYRLPYHHVVSVGVLADDADQAIARAEEVFESGALWDDMPEQPLLRNDWVQQDGRLDWNAEQIPGETFPEREYSAFRYKLDERSVQMLVLIKQAVSLMSQRDHSTIGPNADWLSQAQDLIRQIGAPPSATADPQMLGNPTST